MRWLLLIIASLSQISCTLRVGDEKLLKGGAIEYFEKHYSTATRTPFIGGAMYVNMRLYLYPMVVNYCVVNNNKMEGNWCVDSKGFPLFRVQNDSVNTVVASTGSALITMPGDGGWLSVIERNNIISDREWLQTAQETYHFKPENK